MKKMTRDFTKYVSLNILGMIALSCYILADTYFVSKDSGATGITALNLSISIYSLIHGTGLMLGIGGATRFSILRSQGQEEKAELVFSAAVKSGLIMGGIFALAGLLGTQELAEVLGADALTMPLTSIYLQTILSFAPFFILNNVILAFVRNHGHPKLAMMAMLIGSLSNVVLDYVFMFPLGMGMFGAALATGLAPVISLGILSTHFLWRKDGLAFLRRRILWHLLPDVFWLGASVFIMEASSAVVLFTFNLVILGIAGNLGVAAYGIVANLALVGTAVFTGLTQGIQPLISRYHGLEDQTAVRSILRYAERTAVIIALVIYGTVFHYADFIVRIFNSENNPEIASLADSGLKIYFIGFFFAGLNLVKVMVLSATENARGAFFISISRGLILMVPLVMALSRIYGMNGVWWSFVMTDLLVLLLTKYLVKSDRGAILSEEAA